jgi:hypothetical protein
MGDVTLVDLWIEGKSRAITITREAIESYLGLAPHDAASMGETERREFVRTHLSVVVAAATARLRDNPEAGTIEVDALAAARSPASVGERRTGDRRKGERRKRNLGPPGGVERRNR